MASTTEFFEYIMAKEGAKLVESPSSSVRIVELYRFSNEPNHDGVIRKVHVATTQVHIHDDGFVEEFFADHQHGEDFVKTPGYYVSNVIIDREKNKHHVMKLFVR
ncbi:hypothetical protein ACK32R_23690 [Aeromonas dhakensis]|uniref:hypothetical protein n=1 Tax=Aeromonas dhakensis TaxID=196024 RepID=UPI00398688A8